MSRINTNVSSLVAQNTLRRSNADLQTSLTRLSTGLRINDGKDDPAGLIASESLRRDITSIDKAIGNSERANQMIATADSALAKVSDLLNDIRGLVTEAANSGVLSVEQIAANQLQIDSSLEAIDRIAQITTFQGKRLLDGSLSFLNNAGSVSSVNDIEIRQAVLGSAGQVRVDVDINSAATQGEITNAASVSTNAQANATIYFASEANLTGFTDGATDILIRGTTPGSSLDGVKFSFAADTTAVGSETAVYDKNANTVTIYINNAAATTAGNVVTAIDALVEFDAINQGAAGDAIDGTDANDVAVTDTTLADKIAITAATSGADFNNMAISVVSDSSTLVGAPTAIYSASQNTLKLYINDAADTVLGTLATAISSLAEFSGATATAGNGDGDVRGDTADGNATANTDTTGGGVLVADLTLQITGQQGTEVFNFTTGASVNQMVSAITLVSDATGVTAQQSGSTLTLKSTNYGSNAFVDVNVVSEGAGGSFETGLSATRSTGTDIVAVVNGINANGDGNKFSIDTSTLDMSITVSDGSSENFEFDITGGGAIFQLGPNVVTNQQAALGIDSVNTARLTGVNGGLFELASGNAKAVATDAVGAGKVLDEVISKVTGLRGRLGAFQRTTLESNIASLQDTLANLTEAESSIRDADFAKESAALTRAQILVQSGTSVLAIANSNPQNVLALIR
ncbi:MAG: flagellin [Pirellulaceae bacterium]